jgi:hypothetical protein
MTEDRTKELFNKLQAVLSEYPVGETTRSGSGRLSSPTTMVALSHGEWW